MCKCAILILAASLSAWADEPSLTASLPENDVLCLRATRVPEDLAKAIEVAKPTNDFSGLVLDLRFADGDKDVSTENFPAGKNVPLVVLVNSQTRGTAADLAAKLRSESRAVLIGSTNVTGKITPDIRVAVTAEQEKNFLESPFAKPAGDHNSAISDLLPLIDHTSEAELVRRRVKDGDDAVADAPRNEPAQPVLRDPELARAVDLLKALAVLHKSRG
jgi:hypothetical protein